MKTSNLILKSFVISFMSGREVSEYYYYDDDDVCMF